MNELKFEEFIKNRALMKSGFVSHINSAGWNLAQPGTWELGRFISEHQAVNYARQLGWGTEVQIKRVFEHGQTFFLVEPYEEDCECPNIIKPY